MTRLLVINGDDFGLTRGVNAGMLDAHHDGVLTSVSLFANAPATEDAISIAHATPSLGVGCHLTLVDGTPTLSAAEVPSLVGRDGQFRWTWGAFIRACVLGRVRLDEVRRELTAQITRLRTAGLTLTHFDSHKHVHTYPPIFRIVTELATQFGVPAVRVPYESPWVGPVPEHLRESAIRRQALENLAMRWWTRIDARVLASHGRIPAAFFGKVHTGRVIDHELFLRIVELLPEGASELMMHPGYNDEALSRVRTRLRRQREQEIALLRSPNARQILREAQVTLVRHDMQPVGPPISRGLATDATLMRNTISLQQPVSRSERVIH